MPTPTIPNGEEHFFPIIYEGNGGGQRVGRFVPFDDSSGGTIANSCIFDGSGHYLDKTFSGAGNRQTWTWSGWLKKTSLGGDRFSFFSGGTGSSDTTVMDCQFQGDNIRITGYNTVYLKTNRTFEDSSKFYHILIAFDSTQGTASDRMKLYVDGDEITSFSTDNRSSISQNSDYGINQASSHTVGRYSGSANFYLNGYLSEVNFVDGQSLLPASFGVVDSSTGRWIPAQVKPHPTTTTTYLVTVVGGNPSNHPYYNVGSTNKFAINGSTATADVDLTLYEGATYRFDQSDSSNSGHPLRFSTVAHGTHASGGTEYTTNVTVVGTPGTSGAYTEITVASSAPDLHYYCSSHNGMGYQGSTPNGYGANGFRLTFSDSSSLGADTSGNSNTFSATNLASTDQTTDSPTQNFATHDPSFSGTIGLSEGNLKVSGTQNEDYQTAYVGKNVNSGKWYFEVTATTVPTFFLIGLTTLDGHANAKSTYVGDNPGSYGFQFYPGSNDAIYYDGSNYHYSTGTSLSNGDVIGVAYDADTGEYWIAVNNTWVQSGNPSTGANPVLVATGGAGKDIYFGISSFYNVGVWDFNFGQKPLSYTPPTNFKLLQQDNFPETAKGVSGLVWIKNRDATDSWIWQDSLRGRSEYGSSATATQYNSAITDGVQKFLKGGVQIEDNNAVNTSGESYVAFNWVLNNGTNVTDTSGDLSTELQANPTAGVSVGKFTVSGSGNKTWSHGLGGVPEVGILCAYSSTNSGTFYHHKISTTPYSSGLFLINSNSAFTSSNIWGSAKPTSTLWTGLVGSLFSAGQTYIFYSFRGIEGFSKCSSYTGNGNANGTFVYTGFKPSFLMIKCTTHANNWVVYNNKMNPFNPVGANLGTLFPNRTNSAETQGGIDFCANGFKAHSTYENFNGSGRTYVYMSFAEHPFANVSPATAR